MNTYLAIPEPDVMIRELAESGWKKKMRHIWQSPTGKLYLGPAGAWKVMHGFSSGTEMTIRTVTERP